MQINTPMTVNQVAEKLGIAVSTVHQRISYGTITPSAKLPGSKGAYLFDPEYIEELAAQKQPAALAGATGSQDKEI